MADDFGIVLDLDGTLVDSVYHHVTAWQQAFAEAGHAVPARRIHRAIGMGGNRLVRSMLGRVVAAADDIAARHGELFRAAGDRLRPTPGASDLLDDLDDRDIRWIVATSAGPEDRELLLAVLGRDDVPIVDSGEVSSSKPAEDLLAAACDQAGLVPSRALMVGDSPWDGHAARRIGMDAVLVRCGGFGDDELATATPVRLVDDPRELVGQL